MMAICNVLGIMVISLTNIELEAIQWNIITNTPTIQQKQNIDIFAFVYGYCHIDDPEYLGVGGLLGKKNAHLIKSSTSQSEAHVTFSYELDGNGNPTKVTMISESETTTYKILYK